MSLVIVNTPCTANSQQVLSKLQLDSNPHTLHDIERQSLGDHGTPTSDSGTLIDTFKELPMSSDTIEVPSLTKISNYDVPSPSIKPNREKVKEHITFYIKPDRVVTKVFQGIDHEDVIEEHFETSITGSPSQFGDKDCRPTVFKNECILTRATSDNVWQPTNRRQLRRNETVIHSFMEKETFSPLIRRSASLNQVPSIEVNNVFALLPRKSNLPGDENKNKENEEVNMTSDMEGQYADLEGRDEDTCFDNREQFVRKGERKNSRIKNLDELPNYLIPLVFRSVNPFENPVAYQSLQKKNEKSPEKVHYSEKSTKKKKGGEVTSCGEILSEDSDVSP